MKVCPKCGGITEEKNAIKCTVCGSPIKNEEEYTEDELTDDYVKHYIKLEHEHPKRKRRKIIIISIIAVILLISIITIICNSLKPKGHIIIRESFIVAEVGETIIISPEYYGNITAEDLAMDIEIKDSYTSVPFRYKIIDNEFYLDLYESAEIIITFTSKDDGLQKKYNNIVKIVILSQGEDEYE